MVLAIIILSVICLVSVGINILALVIMVVDNVKLREDIKTIKGQTRRTNARIDTEEEQKVVLGFRAP